MLCYNCKVLSAPAQKACVMQPAYLTRERQRGAEGAKEHRRKV